MSRETYTEAVRTAEHRVALGQTFVYLDSDGEDVPWSKVVGIEEGCSFRMRMPTSFYVIAKDAGLTFKIDVKLEERGMNGKGHSEFNRDRLRAIAMRLPPDVQKKLAKYLTEKVLPPTEDTTAEWRAILNKQMDSEDCIRELIAFCETHDPSGLPPKPALIRGG